MPAWLTFLLAAIVEFIETMAARRAARGRDADSGAAEQRAGDLKAADDAQRRAERIKHDLEQAADADVDRRIDDSL